MFLVSYNLHTHTQILVARQLITCSHSSNTLLARRAFFLVFGATSLVGAGSLLADDLRAMNPVRIMEGNELSQTCSITIYSHPFVPDIDNIYLYYK